MEACPIDVISMCSAGGEILPLRMRITDEEQQMLRVDIDEIVSCKKIQYVGIESHIYLCRATVHDCPWLFELRYLIRSHSWSFIRRIY